jgi:hypothetical protein
MGWTTGAKTPEGPMMGIFLFTTASKPVAAPPPPASYALGTGGCSLVLKRPRREADRSSPSSAQVKNAWNYTSIPPIRLHSVIIN